MIRLADDRLAAVTLATACHGPAMFLGREYLGCWGGGLRVWYAAYDRGEGGHRGARRGKGRRLRG